MVFKIKPMNCALLEKRLRRMGFAERSILDTFEMTWNQGTVTAKVSYKNVLSFGGTINALFAPEESSVLFEGPKEMLHVFLYEVLRFPPNVADSLYSACLAAETNDYPSTKKGKRMSS